MKLSIEAKVATAVAVAFAALTLGTIAQEQSEHGTGGNPGLSQMSLPGSMISSSESHGGTGENEVLGLY